MALLGSITILRCMLFKVRNHKNELLNIVRMPVCLIEEVFFQCLFRNLRNIERP